MNELTITDPIFTALAKDFTEHGGFDPVNVQHGRKFRGFGYYVGYYEKSNGGYSGSGIRPLEYYEVIKVYVPEKKTFAQYNAWKESEVVTVPQEQYQKDLLDYVNGVLEACRKRCGNDRKWRANYLRKILGISGDLVVALLNFMDK